GFAAGTMTRRILRRVRQTGTPSCIIDNCKDPFMAAALKLEFVPFSDRLAGVLIVFCDEGLKFGATARRVLAPTGELVSKVAANEQFKGKNGSTLDILAPAGLEVGRLVVVGVGKGRDLKGSDYVKLGGIAMGK